MHTETNSQEQSKPDACNTTSPPRRRRSRFTRAAATIAVLLGAQTLPAAAATVEVHVAKVAAGKGKINVAVCDREHFLKQCVYSGSAPAQVNAAGETVVRIQNVPAGTWAVLAYQDENSNNDLDRLLGIPRENYGFSNDARGHFGPPGFDEAAVQIAEPTTVTTLKVQ